MKLSVQNPCSEDWNQMQPQAKGRHCDKCAKTVIDFTGMSDRELAAIIKNSQGNVCGRLTQSQLERKLLESKPLKRRKFWPLLAGALFTSPLWAQQETSLPVCPENISASVTEKEFAGKAVQLMYPQTDTVVVTGQALDAQTGETLPVANAIILDENGQRLGGASADFDGNFEIAIALNQLRKMAAIEISFVGYEKKRQLMTYENLTQEAFYLRAPANSTVKDTFDFREEFRLEQSQELQGEVIVVGGVSSGPSHGFSDRGLVNVLVDWVKSW